MSGLALPDPVGLEPEKIGDIGAQVIAWASEQNEVAIVDETRQRWAAVADYVRTHGVIGRRDAEATSRRLEVRVGEINKRPGQGNRTCPSTDRLPRQRAAEFADMAEHTDVVERVIDTSTDEDPPYRAVVLRHVKRAIERNRDIAARAISAALEVDDRRGENWWLLTGDFRDRLAVIPDDSVDLIVTDPPYPDEALPLWSDLAKLAKRVLSPRGLLVAMSGKIALDDVFNRLDEHLTYGWVYCQPLPGPSSRIQARHIGQEWKPWLAYTKGVWPSGDIDWHGDVLHGVPQMKDRYHWQQSEQPAGELIVRLSPEDGLVLDPFLGSGTYGVAALRAGRRFIGVEWDAERFTKAAERVAEVAA